MPTPTAQKFLSIEDTQDQFLKLFPHRFDYIYAPHPEPGQTPDWQTESRHPLSDRLLQQGGNLFGVRFGAQTDYGGADIDIRSRYHPRQDPFAIPRIIKALEPLGVVAYLACTSSYSQGIHLYFPFQEKQSSWEVAIAIATLLENAGFKLAPGQLEIFPNPRPYGIDGKPSLFNAHRLPMQSGSYLLDSDLQPISGNQVAFVHQWRTAQQKNDLNKRTLKRIIKQAQRKTYRISGKADKFINDLNAEIELGWTGKGQTNYLLGRITMREYIFHHILNGGQPLENERLIQQIVEVARSLPGYVDWCQHQHEIKQRAEEWTRCIQNSKYFHYGESQGKYKSKISEEIKPSEAIKPAISSLPSENQQRAETAREKIRRAIAHLLDTDELPSTPTHRFNRLTENYHIGGGTLYKHRDLWHPQFLVENPPDPPTMNEGDPFDCAFSTSNGHNLTSLLSRNASNSLEDKGFSDLEVQDLGAIASNSLNSKGAIDFQVPQGVEMSEEIPLFDLQAWGEAAQEARRVAKLETARIKNEAFEATHVARMQQYLESGDPILMAEALAWAEVNPGVLEGDRLLGDKLDNRPDKTMGCGGCAVDESESGVGEEAAE
jgi:hypothetical protein